MAKQIKIRGVIFSGLDTGARAADDLRSKDELMFDAPSLKHSNNAVPRCLSHYCMTRRFKTSSARRGAVPFRRPQRRPVEVALGLERQGAAMAPYFRETGGGPGPATGPHNVL